MNRAKNIGIVLFFSLAFFFVFEEVQQSRPVGASSVIPTILEPSGAIKGGISAIDKPGFVPSNVADAYLGDDGWGIDVEIDGAHRFYPFQILVWHEVVNDVFRGVAIAVTYDPLCFSSAVFRREMDGRVTSFGVAGTLFNNNLVLYDRETDSLWSQLLAQSIAGELTGIKLSLYPFRLMRFGAWRSLYENGEVLSNETDFFRDYTRDPYGNYAVRDDVYFSLSTLDARLDPKAVILGRVGDDGGAVAYTGDDLLTSALRDEKDVRPAYWFCWSAAWPGTKIHTVKQDS